MPLCWRHWRSATPPRTSPFVMCGLSLGAILALDYATRHPEKLAGLVLISVQYKVPRLLTAIQNFLFRQMSQEVFAEMGITKQQLLNFSDSMKSLDLRGEVARVKCPGAHPLRRAGQAQPQGLGEAAPDAAPVYPAHRARGRA